SPRPRLHGELAEQLGRRDEQAEWPAGRTRAMRFPIERLEHRGRPGADRAVGEQLQPADAGPRQRIGPQQLPAAELPVLREGECFMAQAGVDPEAEATLRREAPVRGEPTVERRLRLDIDENMDSEQPAHTNTSDEIFSA